MANQNRRSHASGKPKLSNANRFERKNRKSYQSLEENTPRHKPLPNKKRENQIAQQDSR